MWQPDDGALQDRHRTQQLEQPREQLEGVNRGMNVAKLRASSRAAKALQQQQQQGEQLALPPLQLGRGRCLLALEAWTLRAAPALAEQRQLPQPPRRQGYQGEGEAGGPGEGEAGGGGAAGVLEATASGAGVEGLKCERLAAGQVRGWPGTKESRIGLRTSPEISWLRIGSRMLAYAHDRNSN